MPTYARDTKAVRHPQNTHNLTTRYATRGLSDQTTPDNGTMWPTTSTLNKPTTGDEQFISALVKKAAG
ncbi:hypothetical protein [Streptomyces sp. CAI-85]|uniref:hypothetical protein n=1 Tax=Streptomyces sp. CAI-85 TaxID=1472662 RepID=UPI0020CA57E5|nr:hypothetical protein [Streptomyces sp. CAI-85]